MGNEVFLVNIRGTRYARIMIDQRVDGWYSWLFGEQDDGTYFESPICGPFLRKRRAIAIGHVIARAWPYRIPNRVAIRLVK